MSLSTVVRNFALSLDKAASSVYIDRNKDPLRYFMLRPSGFPYCGLRRLLEATESMERPRLDALASSYFTSVGSATHEVFQEFIGRTGKVVGDWECVNKKCGAKLKFDTYHACPKCGADMRYRELEVRFRNTVVGHTDALYRLQPHLGRKSQHAVADYKTTSKSKIGMRQYPFPYKSNVAQIEAYVPMLEDQYGVTVDYWLLVYLARDAPFGKTGRKIVGEKLTAKRKAKLMKLVVRQSKVHRKVLRANSMEDFKVIARHKLCSSLTDYKDNYENEYDKCPFHTQCFDAKTLKAVFKNTLKVHAKTYPLIQHAPDYVRKELRI